MSRLGFLFLIFSCFGTALSQVPSYVPTNGLVGWWPFNGNANDESGNGNNGTVNGATLTTDRFGNNGKAYSFDGVDDYIEITNSSSLNYTNGTINIWLNTSQNSFAALVEKLNYSDASNENWAININQNSISSISLFTKQNSNCIPGVGWLTNNVSSVMNNSNWHMITCVMSLNNSSIYADGILINSIQSNTFDVCSGDIQIARHWANDPRRYSGKLDDIGIWNRALTQQEITELYTSSDPFDISATTTTVCAGQPTTLSVQSVSGTITALNCASATNIGTLTAGTAAGGVSSSVPYTGGNGGTHNGQTVASTGVTGLTATLAAGSFASGNGSLTYNITGTPSASGTASFALNIGGQTCALTQSVASISSQYSSGAIFCASGATAIIEVTNPTTGKTWMDRNLGASQAATSSTNATSYGDLYQWGRGIDGHQCRNSTTSSTLSLSDQPGINRFIINSTNPSDWRNPQNNNLWQGVNGINNPCPNGYRVPTSTEIDAERLSWSGNTAAGAFASPLKLPMAGDRLGSNGQLYDVGTGGVYWSSSISSTNSNYISFGASIAGIYSTVRSSGYSVRCIKEIVGSIGALNCGSATLTGNLISGSAATGVSSTVPYTGGNGGFYAAQSVASTGATGLIATISQGLFASGAGNLVYTISGTPSASGTASFVLNIGGQTCNLNITINSVQPAYPTGSVFCTSGPTLVNDVTNPATGKTWMDRNLGASQVATSSTDAAAYGELYQWGRGSDGHQCRNSAATTTLSSGDQPANGNFIITSAPPYDWRSSQNPNLWQGISGTNNPCPSGYRLPTETELNNELLSWSSNNSAGAFASPLKLTMAGIRNLINGSLNSVGTSGRYWSSTVSSNDSRDFFFNSSGSSISTSNRSRGLSVRCIKN